MRGRTSAPATSAEGTDTAAPSESPAGSDTAAPSSDGGTGASDATFIFGAAGAPSMFDPLYATDGETFRVARQMYEGLVAFKPGTADVEPALAESWEQSADGKTWTFKIRGGREVPRRHRVDAEAVCFNFDRMYNQKDAGATQAQYWSDTMGGFKDQKDEAGAADARRCTSPAPRLRAQRGHQADQRHLEVPGHPRPAVVLHPVADRAAAVRREQRRGRG